MAKRTLPVAESLPTSENNMQSVLVIPEALSILNSGVAEMVNGKIIWRIGHIEHVARLYIENPAQTIRDYHDDIIVAQTYTPGKWSALTVDTL